MQVAGKRQFLSIYLSCPVFKSGLSEGGNKEMSKVMTHELVNKVTKAMNEVNFMEFETRVKDLILTLLDKPLTKMTIQEELMTKYSESLRRNIRRTQELEFTLQKY